MNPMLLLILALVVHGIVLSVIVVLERRNPAAGLVWIGALILLPGIGALLHLVFGRRKLRKRRKWRSRTLQKLLALRPPSVDYREEHVPRRLLVNLTRKLTGCHPMPGNRVGILTDAVQAYPIMRQAIRNAGHHVHLEVYRFRSDATSQAFADCLLEVSQRGVEVKVLLDAVGCFTTDLAIFAKLIDAGGRVEIFAPLRLRPLTSRLNFRNHRKILIVDGRAAFVGGLNIGDEYLGLDPGIGDWRDTNLQIEGPAVNQVQQTFLEDWYYATDDNVDGTAYFNDMKSVGSATVQMVASGPAELQWGAIHQSLFRAIAGADSRIHITSPYFIPDEAMLQALTTAALAGVDVRLLVPGASDLPLVRLAGRSYYPELLKAGARVYEYKGGFVHAKTMIIDDWAASVGSANMDIRSFRLNYEINAFVYDRDFVAEMEQLFLHDIDAAKPVLLEEIRGRPLPVRFVEGLARLMSPLM